MRTGFAVSGLAVFVFSPGVFGAVSYHASLNTLPENQGWTYINTGGTIPVSVSGGILSHGPTATSTNSYWTQTLESSVNFTTGTWSIEGDVNILAASWSPGAGAVYRGGYSQLLSDAAGRWAIMEVSSDRIRLRNENIGSTSPTYLFNTVSGFHQYKLEVGPTGARVYLDGAQILSSALGTGSTPRSAFFADATGYGSYNGQIRSMVVIPAPGAGAMLGLTGLCVGRRRR